MTEDKKTTQKKKKLVGTRGRIFKGTVIKKFPHRIVIESERPIFISKYERFLKKKARIHARINPDENVEIGDIVRVQECRPLSKIIHHVMIEKLESTEVKK